MNAPKGYYEQSYLGKAKEVEQIFRALNGNVEVYAACDTLQVNDYSKFNMAGFSEEHKKEMREKQFPVDLEEAFRLGERLVRG
jgi:hypothetical protein